MNRNWHTLYQDGVPATIDTRLWPSVAHMLEDSFEHHAGADAFTNLETTLSYADLDRQSRAFAAWLQHDAGMRPGDRIALMMPNCLQYAVTLLGALRAGLAVVNVNPLYTARELEHQLSDSQAHLIVVLEHFTPTLGKVFDTVDVQQVVTTRLGDFQTPTRRLLTNFATRVPRRRGQEQGLPVRPRDLRHCLSAGASRHFDPPALGPDDLALLQYTGGTTGPARGAMLSHGNIVANIAQCRAWFAPALKRDHVPTIITALPIFHIFALTVNVLLHVSMGWRNVLVADPRNTHGLVKVMTRHAFSSFTGVNTLFNSLLDHPGFRKLDFSDLRMTVAGGMPVQEAVATRWSRVTGQTLIEGYGLSETSPVVACNPINTSAFNHSVGVPLPSTDVEILDDEDQPVKTGATGELCVCGPQVMRGYWHVDSSASFTADGYFRTGDIARQDEHGRIHVIDRKHDTIMVSGFTVYPNEIEDVVTTHPEIKEAACIRVRDEKSGEAIKLFVVRNNRTLTIDAIRAYCRERLTRYKVPKHYEFIDEIPKSDVGKILRRQLR